MKSELRAYQAFVAANVPKDEAAAAATAIGQDITTFLENKMLNYATKDDIAQVKDDVNANITRLTDAMHAQTWRIIGALFAVAGLAVAVVKLV